MRYVRVAVELEETVLLVSGRRMKQIAAVCTVAGDRSGIVKLAAEKGKRDAPELVLIPFLRLSRSSMRT